MSSSVPALAAVLKRTTIDDHEEVLRAAQTALKQSKGDQEAQCVKVVALLKLDRFDDALSAIEAGGAKLKERLQLEYAYALYKSGKAAEAVDVAKGGSQRGLRHVEAQAKYRTEDFAAASRLYRELYSGLEHDEEADLRINTGAVDAQLEWSGSGDVVQKKKPAREDLEAFETTYNAACGSIARGELGQAEVLLRRARDLCNALEDISEEDKQAELLPIVVQQIYVFTKLGREGEAEALAKTIDSQVVPDATTRQISHVNKIAATSTLTNPFYVQRILGSAPEVSNTDHAFQFQSSILNQNRYAIDLESLKYDGTARSSAAVIAKYDVPTLDGFPNGLAVVNAAAHARNSTGKEALKHILPVLEKRPSDVGLILTVVQLYVLTGNPNTAITLLESFLSRLEQSSRESELDVRFAPGLVGTMISLYTGQNRRRHVQREFAKAATYWRRKSKDSPLKMTHLLKAAGRALLESQDQGHQQLANDIFADLRAQDSQDRYSLAGLIAASPSSVSGQQLSVLTPIDRLVSGVEVDALENAGIAQPPSASGTAVVTRKRAGEDTKARKAKKIRKSRMPKDFDPNKTPDPERWLPLRDRSTYRPKGKKGKARANLLSQGAAPTGESDGSRPGTPAAEVLKQKQQAGGGGGKKKKAKNKR